MVGDLPACSGRAAHLEGRGVAGVQAGVLTGQQVVVHGLTHQGVAERVALPVMVDDQDMALHGLAQRALQIRLVLVDCGEQDPVVDLVPPTEAISRTRRVPGDTRSNRASIRSRSDSGILVESRSAHSASSSTKNGMPWLRSRIRAAVRAGTSPTIWRTSGSTCGSASRSNWIRCDVRQPVDLAEPREQGVAAMHLVLAVREHEQDPRVTHRAQEEPQQVAGGGVRPVQVLDDEDQGLGRGEVLHQGRHRLEEPATAQRVGRRRRAELGDEAGQVGPPGAGQLGELLGPEVGDQRAEHRRERRERRAVGPELEAVPHHEPGPLGDGGCELGDEPGLADPGLAAHDGDLRLTIVGQGEQPAQLANLRGAAHEGNPHRISKGGTRHVHHRAGARASRIQQDQCRGRLEIPRTGQFDDPGSATRCRPAAGPRSPDGDACSGGRDPRGLSGAGALQPLGDCGANQVQMSSGVHGVLLCGPLRGGLLGLITTIRPEVGPPHRRKCASWGPGGLRPGVGDPRSAHHVKLS